MATATAHFFFFAFYKKIKPNATGPLSSESKKRQENMICVVISYRTNLCNFDDSYEEISHHNIAGNKRNNNILKGGQEGWCKSRGDEDNHRNKGPGSLHCVTQLRSKCNGHYNRPPDLGKCVMWWDVWDLTRYTILDAKVLDRNVTWLTKHKDTS